MQQQPQPRPTRRFEVGCLVPLGIMLALAVGLGVLIGNAWPRAGGGSSGDITVRITNGPTVISTQIVRVR